MEPDPREQHELTAVCRRETRWRNGRLEGYYTLSIYAGGREITRFRISDTEAVESYRVHEQNRPVHEVLADALFGGTAHSVWQDD